MARSNKPLTYSQVESRKTQAARFTRDVVGDPDRAAEIEAESVEDYAARRHMEIQNPQGRYSTMPRKTIADYRAELRETKDQLQELETENQSLQDQLDQIGDIIAPEDEEDEGDEEEEDDDAEDGEEDEG